MSTLNPYRKRDYTYTILHLKKFNIAFLILHKKLINKMFIWKYQVTCDMEVYLSAILVSVSKSVLWAVGM